MPRALFLAVLLLPAFGGCGYRLGYLAPEGVRSIAVPIFANRTFPFRRGIETELTSAVIQEIRTRSGLVVRSEREADAVLSGDIVAFQETPLSEDALDRVAESSVTVTVTVSLARRGGSPIFKNRTVSETAAFVISRGENLESARREALSEIAQRIAFLLDPSWED